MNGALRSFGNGWYYGVPVEYYDKLLDQHARDGARISRLEDEITDLRRAIAQNEDVIDVLTRENERLKNERTGTIAEKPPAPVTNNPFRDFGADADRRRVGSGQTLP
jgi:hypothetical protein